MLSFYDDEKLAAIFKRDRVVVVSGLAVLTLLAWAYLIHLGRDMGSMAVEMTALQSRSMGFSYILFIFIMWAVMMVAMMVPTAAPMILMFASINRKRLRENSAIVPTALFLAGYLTAWVWYSVLAAVGQWGLHKAAMLSPMMVSNNEVLGGILLIAAGIFQFSSLKYACLKRCRSPLGFLLNEWQEGRRGAFLMGLRNGNYCVGCCWALMLLMLVAGTMNLLWMAIIAGFVLVEKVAPAGRLIGYLSGFVLMAWGVWMLAAKVI